MANLEKPDSAFCNACTEDGRFTADFSMAYQPIVDVEKQQVHAYEALIRGTAGEPAPTILSRVDSKNRYNFDQRCRVRAIEIASRLGIDTRLSINFLPNAVYQAEHCVQSTLSAARQFDFPIENIIFEFTESEKITDIDHVLSIIRTYKALGFSTALDDFGSGYAGLATLAALQPDIVKFDMSLIRGIHADKARQAIMRGSLQTCRDLDMAVIAEGVETVDEARWLQDQGIDLLQGYLFAKPGFETLPQPDFSML